MMVCASMGTSCGNTGTKSSDQDALNGVESSSTPAVDDDITVLSDRTDENGVRTIAGEPSDVCSRKITVSVKDGVILKVEFEGGCPGNTHGVAVLVQGMSVEEAIGRLEGIRCGGNRTSCPDQLSKVLKMFR